MISFLSNLASGVLANLISDGIETGTKYVLSERELDMKLRKSVNALEERQINVEGAIESLLCNQEFLISVFKSIIEQYQLQSRVYIENQNIVVITNSNDIDWSTGKLLNQKNNVVVNLNLGETNVFDEYHDYVKKMRGEFNVL